MQAVKDAAQASSEAGASSSPNSVAAQYCLHRTNKQPLKKIVIRPLSIKPRVPENFEANTWERLQAAVRAVHAKQPVSSSLESLYRAVEDICQQRLAGSIYEKLQAECEAHIESRLELLVGQTPDVLAFLGLVQACWTDHCEQMIMIRSIFLFLDRTYIMMETSLKSLWDMGLHIFLAHLRARPEVCRKTVEGLLALIEAERNGEQVDRSLLSSLLRMLHELTVYGDAFEGLFLAATDEYCERRRGEGARAGEGVGRGGGGVGWGGEGSGGCCARPLARPRPPARPPARCARAARPSRPRPLSGLTTTPASPTPPPASAQTRRRRRRSSRARTCPRTCSTCGSVWRRRRAG